MENDEKMENDEVGEKIFELNDIFEELITDARELTRDLVTSISQWKFTTAFMFLLSLIIGWYVFTNYEKLGWSLLTLGACIILLISVGIVTLLHYFKLKKRYVRLFEIQKQLDKIEGK